MYRVYEKTRTAPLGGVVPRESHIGHRPRVTPDSNIRRKNSLTCWKTVKFFLLQRNPKGCTRTPKKEKIRQSAAKPSVFTEGRFRDYNRNRPRGEWYSPIP